MKNFCPGAVVDKLYRVVAYIRVDAESDDYVYYESAEEAMSEVNHCMFMQPENIYKVEEVTVEDADWPTEPEIIKTKEE